MFLFGGSRIITYFFVWWKQNNFIYFVWWKQNNFIFSFDGSRIVKEEYLLIILG